MHSLRPLSRWREPWFQWLILALGVLLLALFVGWSHAADHRRIEAFEKTRLQTQLRVVADNLTQQLRATSAALESIRTDVALLQTAFKGQKLGITRLKSLGDAMPGVRTLLVLDAEGRVLLSDRDELIGRDFSERPYFLTARAGADPQALYVSEPFRTVLGAYAFNMVKVIQGVDGRFAGIVSATLDPVYFETLMESVRYAPDMWCALAHGGGRLAMHVPPRPDLHGSDLSRPGTMFSKHRATGQEATLLHGLVLSTGEVSLMAQRTLSPLDIRMDFPLQLAVARSDDMIYADWRRGVKLSAWFVALVALLACAGLFEFQRRQRDYAQLAQRRAEERRLAETEQRIAAAAFESQEGCFVTDASRRILKVNKAFTAITGYLPEDVIGQTPKLLSSGLHDAAFYRAMWESIGRTGTWQGEIVNRRKSGEVFPEWLTISVVRDEHGQVTHHVANFMDISARKTAEDEIRTLAFFDPLTKLPNRRLLMDRLTQAMAGSLRHLRKGALFFVDLDHFKTINDTNGHVTGDRLLVQVAQRLSTCVREGDTVARLGGDEFVVMLENLADDSLEAGGQARAVGQKILEVLGQPYELGPLQHHSTPSIGITLFGGAEAEGVEEPLKRADLAMYQAKAAGRNTLRFFEPQMQATVARRSLMEAGLREALAAGQFLLHYQAQLAEVDGECQAERVVGAEALVRWAHPAQGLVPPGEFIALAEESGLIVELGRWVVQQACRQLVLWSTHPVASEWSIAVNVSARQLRHADFVEDVLTALRQTGAKAERLKIEITESMLLENVDEVIGKMEQLRHVGVSFSLDDFGTGYSSLAYLKRLPLKQLKIDQSFVRDILVDQNDMAIAQMVIALSRSLGLDVIAEGVETQAQCKALNQIGCLAYQGYFFGRPLPIAAFEAAHLS